MNRGEQVDLLVRFFERLAGDLRDSGLAYRKFSLAEPSDRECLAYLLAPFLVDDRPLEELAREAKCTDAQGNEWTARRHVQDGPRGMGGPTQPGPGYVVTCRLGEREVWSWVMPAALIQGLAGPVPRRDTAAPPAPPGG